MFPFGLGNLRRENLRLFLWTPSRDPIIGDRRAKPELLESREIERQLPPNPVDGSTLLNLAIEYNFDRDYATAETVEREAVEVSTKWFGEPHPQVAHPLADLSGYPGATG